MKIYKVSYWSEGPSKSHTEEVLVVAGNKKKAVKIVNKECCIYKVDRELTTAKLFKKKEGVLIGYIS